MGTLLSLVVAERPLVRPVANAEGTTSPERRGSQEKSALRIANAEGTTGTG